MARHTFSSQVCLAQGVPIETASRSMGHKNISTTQRYAKVTHEKVDRDVAILSNEIEGKYSLSGIDAPPSRILKDMSRHSFATETCLSNDIADGRRYTIVIIKKIANYKTRIKNRRQPNNNNQ